MLILLSSNYHRNTNCLVDPEIKYDPLWPSFLFPLRGREELQPLRSWSEYLTDLEVLLTCNALLVISFQLKLSLVFFLSLVPIRSTWRLTERHVSMLFVVASGEEDV